MQSLEAILGRASRLRTSITDAQAALDALEPELEQRRRDEPTSKARAEQLRTELARSEADLRQMETDLRELETQRREAVRNPSPPPRTLPFLGSAHPGQDRDVSAKSQQLRRAEAELTQRIGVQRQQARLADRSADDAGRAVVVAAAEVDRQRDALTALRSELAQLPSDAEVAAGIAAAAAASREGHKPSALALSDIPDDHLNL